MVVQVIEIIKCFLDKATFNTTMDGPLWENDGCKTKPAISPNLLGGQALFTQALHPNAFVHISTYIPVNNSK